MQYFWNFNNCVAVAEVSRNSADMLPKDPLFPNFLPTFFLSDSNKNLRFYLKKICPPPPKKKRDIFWGGGSDFIFQYSQVCLKLIFLLFNTLLYEFSNIFVLEWLKWSFTVLQREKWWFNEKNWFFRKNQCNSFSFVLSFLLSKGMPFYKPVL